MRKYDITVLQHVFTTNSNILTFTIRVNNIYNNGFEWLSHKYGTLFYTYMI